MEYVARYRHYYHSETNEEVWCEVAMSEGYAMIAAAMSLDPWLQFSGVGIADGAFVRQEVDKILSEKKP